MSVGKQNCWEYRKCGREQGGTHAMDRGGCPAAGQTKLDGVHGGRNGGRACWAIAGTLCEGEAQGSFAKKHKNCTTCDFYMLVEREEGTDFLLSTVLLKKMKFG